jgi:hypothetical protein
MNRKGVLNKCCDTCLKRFKCHICDYKCSTDANLKKHIKQVHDKIKDVVCLQCDYKTSTNNNLQKHIKQVHDKVKDHECLTCDMKFSTNVDLRRHIKMVHDKIKNYECLTCDMKFSTNGNLQKHIKICTGEINCSSGEFEIMKVLEKLGLKKDMYYIYDQSYELKDKSYLRWDFRILADEPIFIEYDGECHFFPVKYGGISEERAKENLIKAQRRDKLKNNYCDDNGYALLRIPYWEKKNIETLVTEFLNDYIMISQPLVCELF